MFSLNYFSPVLWFYIHAMEWKWKWLYSQTVSSVDFFSAFDPYMCSGRCWSITLISLSECLRVSRSVFPSPLRLTSILLSLFSLLPGLFTFLHLAVRQKSPVFLRPQFRNKVCIAGPGISSQGDSWFITDPVTESVGSLSLIPVCWLHWILLFWPMAS